MGDGIELRPENAKLVTLARAARSRTGAAQGAAVRDADGRTYVASAVELTSLRLSAVQAAVAAAASSGTARLEAVAVVGSTAVLAAADRAVLDEVSVTVVLLADDDGTVYQVN